MFERDLRTLSFVPRWVITRNIHTQSVAEHSFYVAVYAGQLAEYLDFEGNMGDLYHAALWHDAEECFTGDIPGPAKRHMFDISLTPRQQQLWVRDGLSLRFPGQMRPVTYEMRLILKVANLLDEVFYKATEIQMGNHGAHHSLYLSRDRLLAAIDNLPVNNKTTIRWHEIKEHIKELVMAAVSDHIGGEDRLPEENSDVAPRN